MNRYVIGVVALSLTLANCAGNQAPAAAAGQSGRAGHDVAQRATTSAPSWARP